MRGETPVGVWLERRLDFGNFAVEDRVELTPLTGSFARTAAGPGWPASTPAIRIEEPQPEALYLRVTRQVPAFVEHLRLAFEGSVGAVLGDGAAERWISRVDDGAGRRNVHGGGVGPWPAAGR